MPSTLLVVCCVDETGVAAQIAEPLADVQMSTYYISTYGLGHTLVCIDLTVQQALRKPIQDTLTAFGNLPPEHL